MRLILASSVDGFLARGATDNMNWLGQTDKAIFRFLTMTGGPLGVSYKTAKLMPTPLAGRPLKILSTNPVRGISLNAFANANENAWLLGGPSLAKRALEYDLLAEVHMCYSHRYAFNPDLRMRAAEPTGIPDFITPWLIENSWENAEHPPVAKEGRWNKRLTTTLNDVTVVCWKFEH